MKRVNILSKLKEAGIIAVVRGKTKKEALQASHALIKGGIVGIEVTYTIANASELITELTEFYAETPQIVIGAGTVLDAVTARIAIMAGAQHIVSPCFDAPTAEICNLYQIPYLPGCLTITEIKEALASGVDIIKLFPGSVYGPTVISAYKAPLPQINLMPTGGVTLENMGEWFKQGALAVGVGGNLLAPAAKGEYEKITEMAEEYIRKLKEIKES